MRERGRELRRAKRTPRRNAAWIGLASGSNHIPCVLWDISDSGARVAAPRSSTLPPAFNLLLSRDGSAQRRCRVVWRNNGQMGVQFIQGATEELDEVIPFRRASMGFAAPPPSAEPNGALTVETASLVLPGYGARFLERQPRRGIRLSWIAGGMLSMLVAATVTLFIAAMQGPLDVPWAVQVCSSAANFCEHPEWTGIAGALMGVVYLAVRGMED